MLLGWLILVHCGSNDIPYCRWSCKFPPCSLAYYDKPSSREEAKKFADMFEKISQRCVCDDQCQGEHNARRIPSLRRMEPCISRKNVRVLLDNHFHSAGLGIIILAGGENPSLLTIHVQCTSNSWSRSKAQRFVFGRIIPSSPSRIPPI